MKKLLLALALLPSICFANQWECMKKAGEWGCQYYRAEIPLGWLVETSLHNSSGITYVPDIAHSWKV